MNESNLTQGLPDMDTNHSSSTVVAEFLAKFHLNKLYSAHRHIIRILVGG